VKAAGDPTAFGAWAVRPRRRRARLRLRHPAGPPPPAGGRVCARLSHAGAHAVLVISMVGASVAPTAGLRLNIARQVAEHHGGTLTTASEGPGPTLTLSLPLA